MQYIQSILISLFVTISACDSAPKETQTVQKVTLTQEIPAALLDSLQANYQFPYDLQSAEEVADLPPELVEASGVSFVKGKEEGTEWLVMVQDESGVVYVYDFQTKRIIKKIPFYKDGDYEGIVSLQDERVFVLKSNGTLYEVSTLDGKEGLLQKYPTFLNGDHDTEGLEYDPKRNRLLVFSKEPYFKGEQEFVFYRVAYEFDLVRRQMAEEPALIIDLRQLKNSLSHFEQTRSLQFNPSTKKDFKPSGFAIHPQTGNYYVISSTGKLLIVMNEQQQILDAEILDREHFAQPEGICFAPNGDMYIVSEGREGVARLSKFKQK